MKNIPFTKAMIVSGAERQGVVDDLLEAAEALEESAKLNQSLLADLIIANAKIGEYEAMLMMQSEATQQIMQVNLLVADALGKIRARAAEGDDPGEITEFVDETCVALEAALAEFDSGEALA